MNKKKSHTFNNSGHRNDSTYNKITADYTYKKLHIHNPTFISYLVKTTIETSLCQVCHDKTAVNVNIVNI